MSNVLYMAISKDGYIADVNGETPWSDAEWEAFKEFVVSCDVVLVGKRTFRVMQKEREFVEGPRYIVVTSDKDLDTGKLQKIAINSREDIPKVGKLGIIGGGDLNGRLAILGLIDEMVLDIEPIALEEGKRLFGDHDIPLKLALLGSRQIRHSTTQRHYKVISSQ